ncbi:MAG: dTDP-4-dehydrorhamnose reductase [Candidatus Erginobacter occultus]|nr:dTDP-4-dehydrorhamnose reductase [Candidatus Erginobacter occultus]
MPPTPSILVIGHRGLLGRECRKVLDSRFPVSGADLDSCDITRPEQVRATLEKFRPGWVINAAANTDVDGCQADPDRAWKVNAAGPGNLARACRDRDIKLLQVSTDFVFDGEKTEPYREDDPPRPLSVYGASKRGGEEAVASAGGGFLIVRTSWLFGTGGKNFPQTILKAAAGNRRLEVVSDQRGSPTSARDLAAGFGELIARDASGIVHLTNRGDCSWYEYAAFVVKTAGIEAEVVPVSSEKLARPAPRPRYSVLSLDRYREITGKSPRSWPEAVREFVLGIGETVIGNQ